MSFSVQKQWVRLSEKHCTGQNTLVHSTARHSSSVAHSFIVGKMANPLPVCVLLIGIQIPNAFGAMYEAYTIEPAAFVVNTTGQMTHFMCSVNAGKNGHTAFRISNDTGRCEMGNITANATQSHHGIKVYVESSITVQKCIISPTIASEIYPRSSSDP